MRAVGLALIIFGLMGMIATAVEAEIFGKGAVAIGLSLYLIAGDSYSYYTFATGGFTVCATGDGTGANSDGGATCPKSICFGVLL